MSLYYDAASILSPGPAVEGSLKSRIYRSDSDLRSPKPQIYALISETSKYDVLLKEVIQNASILALEPKLTPLLSLFLVHDHLLSKRGIAAPANHPLKLSIDRHKARLHAELTKSRIRRQCATIEDLKKRVAAEKNVGGRTVQVRWVRVNNLKSNLSHQLSTTFADYAQVSDLSDIINASPVAKLVLVDKQLPDILAIPPDANLIKTAAYRRGEIILQEKASCFPAYLLLDLAHTHKYNGGDILDACAAPGNKTTQLASILAQQSQISSSFYEPKIYACERDAHRSKTLEKMLSVAGADKIVTVLAKQDFMAIDPTESRFRDVTHLLLDPSCSGSGILGREDIPKLALPDDQRRKDTKPKPVKGNAAGSTSRKRRLGSDVEEEKGVLLGNQQENTDIESEEIRHDVDTPRLVKLSLVQTKIIEHAFSFPAARRVTYSTCSTHILENENVVANALDSRIAKERGWRILRRAEQVEGLRMWEGRGVIAKVEDTVASDPDSPQLNEEQREGCIRCQPGDGNGTMGFFVCGFVRESTGLEYQSSRESRIHDMDGKEVEEVEGEDTWEGFSDNDKDEVLY